MDDQLAVNDKIKPGCHNPLAGFDEVLAVSVMDLCELYSRVRHG
jgi:hypothetical protein